LIEFFTKNNYPKIKSICWDLLPLIKSYNRVCYNLPSNWIHLTSPKEVIYKWYKVSCSSQGYSACQNKSSLRCICSLDVDVPNVNLCCLLITQCSQKGRVTFVSPWSNFWLERIFKPFSDMWPSFWCHIIIFSSKGLADTIDASTSWYISLIITNKFAAIFLAFKTINALLMIFMIPLSHQILQPRLSNCPMNKIFFFKPFTCHISEIVRIKPL